jgi:hypothetical protein
MPLRGLYDTGADVTCIEETVFRRIPVDKRPEKLFLDPKLRFKSAGSDCLDVKGFYRLSVRIGKKTVTHNFYVIRRLSEEVILGFDFIQAHHLNYCTMTKNFSWRSEAKWSAGRLKVSEQKILSPLSVTMVKANVRTESGLMPAPGTPCLINVIHPESPLIRSDPVMVHSDDYGNVRIPVTNCSPEELELQRNDFVGFVENLEDCDMRELNPQFIRSVSQQLETKPTPISASKAKFIQENLKLDGIPEEYRERYRKLILKHHEAISQHKFDLGRANTLMH